MFDEIAFQDNITILSATFSFTIQSVIHPPAFTVASITKRLLTISMTAFTRFPKAIVDLKFISRYKFPLHVEFVIFPFSYVSFPSMPLLFTFPWPLSLLPETSICVTIFECYYTKTCWQTVIMLSYVPDILALLIWEYFLLCVVSHCDGFEVWLWRYIYILKDNFDKF